MAKAILNYEEAKKHLIAHPKKWLVTGAAGFIGSNLSSRLFELNQEVVGVDNFSNGLRINIQRIEAGALKSKGSWTFFEGDLSDKDFVATLPTDFNFINHQAALGSVPRSFANPHNSHNSNVNGFFNILELARQNKIPIVYASSSSVYGDEKNLPKIEEVVGRVLSPYAATKKIKELYSDVFAEGFQMQITGLRYFNVFGPRQNPEGAYAAVIPKWFGMLLSGQTPTIFGDGSTTRDFTFIENVLQANTLAAVNAGEAGKARIFNIAAQRQTSLLDLYNAIAQAIRERIPDLKISAKPQFTDFRQGDIKDSLANIDRAFNEIGYKPIYSLLEGVQLSADWYIQQFREQ